MTQENYLPKVKEQYEDLPYPPRNPEDEKDRLVHTLFDLLEMMNHLGFKGKQDFKQGFRCLVAGGGTGDATIFLADQLKDFPNIEVVQVDLSDAALNICKERAKIRGLNNIKWVQGSLLDLDKMDIGEFDYINCSGVLHHLENPADGLKSLNSVLKDDGIMGIMVYGTYGRLNIYPLQECFSYINENVTDNQEKIENTKSILKCLPKNHFTYMNELVVGEFQNAGDSGLYDLLLHSQDRAYTVPDIYDWVEGCDLNIIGFLDTVEKMRGYKVENYIKDESTLEMIKKLPLKKQQSIAEILNGKQSKHLFYVGKNDSENYIASINNKKLIPFFTCKDVEPYMAVAKNMEANIDAGTMVITQGPIQITLPTSKEGAEIIRYIDGNNSIEQIQKKAEKKLKKLGVKTSPKKIDEAFKVIYERFYETGNMWLRDKSVGELR